MVDWEKLKDEYEQNGLSLMDLAVKYGVSKSTIGWHAKNGQWKKPAKAVRRPTSNRPIVQPSPSVSIQPSDLQDSPPAPLQGPPLQLPDTSLADLARQGLQHLAQYLNEGIGLSLREHKLFADALAQYAKIESLLPPSQQSDQTDISLLSDEQLDQLERWVEEAKAKITPTRKEA